MNPESSSTSQHNLKAGFFLGKVYRNRMSLFLMLFVLPIFLTGCLRVAGPLPTAGQTKPHDPTGSVSTGPDSPGGVLLPSTTPQKVMGRIVHAASVVLRADPAEDSEEVGEVREGEEFVILQSFYSNDWHKIEYQGQSAFISADFLMILEPGQTPPEIQPAPAEPAAPEEPIVGIVTQDQVNIRAEASTSGERLGKASKGDELIVLQELVTADWHKVEFEGQEGYIHKDFFRINGSDDITGETPDDPVEDPAGEDPEDDPVTEDPGEDPEDPESSAEKPLTGVITGSEVNIRSSATSGANILGTAQRGDELVVLSAYVRDDWHKVEFKGKTGYVHAAYFRIDGVSPPPRQPEPAEEEPEDDVPQPLEGVVTGKEVNIRASASTTGTILGKAYKGESYVVLDAYVKDGWHKIEYKGNTGYIHGAYFLIDGETDQPDPPSQPAPEPDPAEEPDPPEDEVPLPPGTPVGTVTGTSANIRSSASSTSTLLGKVYKGTELPVLESFARSDWHKVWYKGKIGYIHADYFKVPGQTSEPDPAPEEPAPEEPDPEEPVPEEPDPEDPAPEDPDPEEPAPVDPDPKDPADPTDPTDPAEP